MDNNINIIQEDRLLPKKGRGLKELSKKELAIVIIIPIIYLALIILDLIITVPLMEFNVINNTLNEIMLDYSILEDVGEAWDKTGVSGNIKLNLPQYYTKLKEQLGVDVSFEGSQYFGACHFTLTSEENSCSYEISYDKKNVGLRGILEDDEQYICLPRDNFEKALSKSVFAPESGSKYALDEQDYDNIISLIEGDDEVTEELELILADVKNIITRLKYSSIPQQSLGVAEERFALVRRIKYVYDKDGMERVLDILKDALLDSRVLFDYLEDEKGKKITEEKLEDLFEQLKESLPDITTEFTYSISDGKLYDITVSETGEFTRDEVNFAINNDLEIKFEYGTFIDNIKISNKQHQLAENQAKFSKNKSVTTVDETIDVEFYNGTSKRSIEMDYKTEQVLKINGATRQRHTASTGMMFFHNLESGDFEFRLFDGYSDLISCTGRLYVDPDEGVLEFALYSLKEENYDYVAKTGLKIDISLKNADSISKTEIENYTSLLDLDDDGVFDLIKHLEIDDCADLYNTLTNKVLCVYTMYGEVVFKAENINNLSNYYSKIYKNYVKFCKESYDIPFTKLYVYNEDFDIYFIIDGENSVKCSYYLTDEITSSYREATVNGKTLDVKV